MLKYYCIYGRFLSYYLSYSRHHESKKYYLFSFHVNSTCIVLILIHAVQHVNQICFSTYISFLFLHKYSLSLFPFIYNIFNCQKLQRVREITLYSSFFSNMYIIANPLSLSKGADACKPSLL